VPLTGDVARSSTGAGFTVHHCGQHDPLYRLGWVRLMLISGGFQHLPPRPGDGSATMTGLATAAQITGRACLTADGIDRVIRLSTAVAVPGVAGVSC
jgi:hypothetical protein